MSNGHLAPTDGQASHPGMENKYTCLLCAMETRAKCQLEGSPDLECITSLGC